MQVQEVGAVLSVRRDCSGTQLCPDVALPLTVTSGAEVFILSVRGACESAPSFLQTPDFPRVHTSWDLDLSLRRPGCWMNLGVFRFKTIPTEANSHFHEGMAGRERCAPWVSGSVEACRRSQSPIFWRVTPSLQGSMYKSINP